MSCKPIASQKLTNLPGDEDDCHCKAPISNAASRLVDSSLASILPISLIAQFCSWTVQSESNELDSSSRSLASELSSPEFCLMAANGLISLISWSSTKSKCASGSENPASLILGLKKSISEKFSVFLRGKLSLGKMSRSSTPILGSSASLSESNIEANKFSDSCWSPGSSTALHNDILSFNIDGSGIPNKVGECADIALVFLPCCLYVTFL